MKYLVLIFILISCSSTQKPISKIYQAFTIKKLSENQYSIIAPSIELALLPNGNFLIGINGTSFKSGLNSDVLPAVLDKSMATPVHNLKITHNELAVTDLILRESNKETLNKLNTLLENDINSLIQKSGFLSMEKSFDLQSEISLKETFLKECQNSKYLLTVLIDEHPFVINYCLMK